MRSSDREDQAGLSPPLRSNLCAYEVFVDKEEASAAGEGAWLYLHECCFGFSCEILFTRHRMCQMLWFC